MAQLKNVKIQPIGNSFYILIPVSFISNELVDLSQEYDVTLKPVKKEPVDLSTETIKDLTTKAVMKETKQAL